MPSRIASHQLKFHSFMASATVAPTNAQTEPTDRSMWPAMMTITMPMARIRT